MPPCPCPTCAAPRSRPLPPHLRPSTSRLHSPLLAAATAARNAEYCSWVGRPRVRSKVGPPLPSPPLLPPLRSPSLRPCRSLPSPPGELPWSPPSPLPPPPPPSSPIPTFSRSSRGGGGGDRGRGCERGDAGLGGGGRGGRGGRGGGGLRRTGDGGFAAAAVAAAAVARGAAAAPSPDAMADLEEVKAVIVCVSASVAAVCWPASTAVELPSSPWFEASAAERWSESFGAAPSSSI